MSPKNQAMKYSDEDKQRVIGEIDRICDNLQNKIK